MKINSDAKIVTITLSRKEAVHLGALLDACLDTANGVAGVDIGITFKQMVKAEANMTELSTKLLELE